MKEIIDYSVLALELDAKERPLEAAWAYEMAIVHEQATLEQYLNLVVLYFEALDYGFRHYHNLSSEFSSAAWPRMLEVLKLAKAKFGDHSEIVFWHDYILSIYQGFEDLVGTCKGLLSNNDSLLPATFLFLSGDKSYSPYIAEAKRLLSDVTSGLTQRQRYLKSVVEAGLAHHEKYAHA